MAIREINLTWMRALSAEKELRAMAKEDAFVVKDYRRDADPEPVAGIVSGKMIQRLIELGIVK